MNEKLAEFARKEIKEGLKKLDNVHFLLFKRMYSHNNLDATIDEAVDNMKDEQLDLALGQVERTLKKLGR